MATRLSPQSSETKMFDTTATPAGSASSDLGHRARGTSRTPLISMRNIRKSFGSVQALRGASVEVHAGEIVALVGDNGAGKSTLVKVMAGVHGHDSGDYEIDGVPARITCPADATRHGIQTVYQDLSL